MLPLLRLRRLFLTAVLTTGGALPLAAAPLLERVDLFAEGQAGFVSYRIPGIVVTAKGTVLAYCEARKFTPADRGELEIHLRRSSDGGRTWSPQLQIAHLGPRLPRNPHLPDDKKRKDMGGPEQQTVNNPMFIAMREGPVHFVYCVEYMRVFHARSDDDGVTWSPPVEITATLERFRLEVPWQAVATGPGHGLQLRSGRLVVPVWLANYDKDPAPPLRRGCSVIFSDDQGASWQRGDLAMTIGGESSVAELSDGRVMLSSRNTDKRNRRAVVFSADGATGWSTPQFLEDVLEPGCMAGLVRHPGVRGENRPLLLHSSPHTTKREHRERKNVSIHVSQDDGRTWPVRKLLQAGPSAYSDLAVLPDGTVLCFYESGKLGETRRNGDWAYARLTVARFNLEWLLAENRASGADSARSEVGR
ncbi:MAG: exo-alpha-sialidase [Verrucomicrobia bacterium]|nr:exo-alpha-sialidase [Verrucomicrobiota bacterium]